MTLFERLTAKAQQHPQKLVLPENTEPRTVRAADYILGIGAAEVIFIGKKEDTMVIARERNLQNIEKATWVDPADEAVVEPYAQLFAELRKKKGISIEDARKQACNPLYLGCLMIKAGHADCMVAGALAPTSHVLRAAFQVLKTKPGISVVSGAFIMLLPEHLHYGTDHMLIFADCAVVPDPTAAELAQIAISTAATARNIAGFEPRVAMLSFSTKGSASHERIDKVIEAVKMVHEIDPSLPCDGELQSDAAIVPEIGAKKAPGSEIAGHANTLIFPSLEVGNIAYKLVQRMAHAEAIGPILQGMAAPINDLSRGCSVDDIVGLVAITACQAGGMK